ncbi:hypothetical protein STEG23_033402, partial [Scotinomys teguina]
MSWHTEFGYESSNGNVEEEATQNVNEMYVRDEEEASERERNQQAPERCLDLREKYHISASPIVLCLNMLHCPELDNMTSKTSSPQHRM